MYIMSSVNFSKRASEGWKSVQHWPFLRRHSSKYKTCKDSLILRPGRYDHAIKVQNREAEEPEHWAFQTRTPISKILTNIPPTSFPLCKTGVSPIPVHAITDYVVVSWGHRRLEGSQLFSSEAADFSFLQTGGLRILTMGTKAVFREFSLYSGRRRATEPVVIVQSVWFAPLSCGETALTLQAMLLCGL